MKNLTLLRLAGFGFFGAVFLSPRPGESEEWLADKFNLTERLTNRSFILPALFRENRFTAPKINHPQPNSTPKPNILFTTFIKEDPPENVQLLLPLYDSALNETLAKTPVLLAPIPPQKTVKNIAGDSVTVPPAIIEVVAGALETAGNGTAEQTAAIAIGSASLNNIDPTVTMDDSYEQEKITPPTFYVDEVESIKTTRTAALVPIITTRQESGIESYPDDLMQLRIYELAEYAEEYNFSGEYAFMVNLGLKSGKKRFFVVDLKQRKIVKSGLVAHGRGKEKFTLKKYYSNSSGSSCSSLGLYKVGAGYMGSFGKSFRLIGLEKTNNNALNRSIVLHAMSCIPDEEIDYPICQSEGCPSLSDTFLAEISPLIKNSRLPLLLWMFDPTITTHTR